MSKVKPITPDEIAGKKKELFPDEVILAFNELIAENATNGWSKFSSTDVVRRVKLKLGYEPDVRVDTNWLNVEDIYREAGWVVQYRSPDPGDLGGGYFTFSRR